MADSADRPDIQKSEAQPAASKRLICPYCGDTQPVSGDGPERCRSCAGLFEPLSRQATHNAMGPWFVRDPQRPHQPGCSYETLVRLIQRGKVTKFSIVRGPTTRQFWTIAKRVPGLSHLLGYCHECDASVDPGDHGCHACGVTFGAFLDRNFLGLPEYRPLPWEQSARPDDPSARTWHGLPTIRELREESRRLSSFATDEELRGEAPIEEVPQDAPVSGLGAPAAAPQNDRNLEVTARLMRRRVARQQRTIFRLTVLSAALACLATLAMIGWVAATIDRPQPQAPAVPAPAKAAIDEPSAEAPPVDPVSKGIANDLEPPPVVEPDDVDAVEVDGDRVAEIEAQFDRAATLLASARDEERELANRIADVEEAIAIIARIKNEPRDFWPEGVEERAEESRRLLERLRLREFFP